MDVFQFRDRLIADYAEFARSFTRIRAADIKAFVDEQYTSGRYWPAPLVQLNPSFQPGDTVEELAAQGAIHAECARIFRHGKTVAGGGETLRLHRHQQEAIGFAKNGDSYVLTTGTGSGKSLSYFIPIVDYVLREKAKDPKPRTRAIVIYPMNALANSQVEELRKFLAGYQPGTEPFTFGRYTGQEDETERTRLATNPPDILLTNFMMLELLMTRQNQNDRSVIENAKGMRFLVLDELHTYRGRQGADVGMLVRRVREALSDGIVCVGTSATMASADGKRRLNEVVSEVATRIFGIAVKPASVITETLQRVTPDALNVEAVKPKLASAIAAGIRDDIDDASFKANPVSVWVELVLGLAWSERDNKWVRARPITIREAARRLSTDSGASHAACGEFLAKLLMLGYAKGVFAFKLHQFISGAGRVYTSLNAPGQRYLTLDGQQFVPGDRSRPLYHSHFCRECGQEYLPIWRRMGGSQARLTMRDIDDRFAGEEAVENGFFVPDVEGTIWSDSLENYPETWLDYSGSEPKLKTSMRPFVPQRVRVDSEGNIGESKPLPGWYVPGSFRFCLECGETYTASGKDSLRLTALSGEGRSSATTMLTLGCLRYLHSADVKLSDKAKKILGFTDNRQDAALQSGHFNDFLNVLLLRAGVLSAVKRAPGKSLAEKDIASAVFDALGFGRDDRGVRAEYMQDPDIRGAGRRQVQDTMRDMLGYRLFYDLRRGWRFNNPNLEQLRLISVDYLDVEEAARDADLWKTAPALLKDSPPETREKALRTLLDEMRQGLCIKSQYLDRYKLEQLRSQSYNSLREPWGFAEDGENPESGRIFITRRLPSNARGREAWALVPGGARSRLGAKIRRRSLWGDNNPHFGRVDEPSHQLIVEALLGAAKAYGIVAAEETDFGLTGYQVNAAALVWKERVVEEKERRKAEANEFFRSLYLNVAEVLSSDVHQLFDFEAREHTAQVEIEDRLEREARFRFEEADKAKTQNLERLPVLFCSPTMELGVDISALNTVYLRNVPPTPANYAQRSGRAGRAGQPALVITYCASQSPHDQYFFQDPARMAYGQVNPPTLDLANRDLLESHFQAIWLAVTGAKLGDSVKSIIDLAQREFPIVSALRQEMDRGVAREEAKRRSKRVLDMLKNELDGRNAPWFVPGWLEAVIDASYGTFDRALERWRQLYRATSLQMELNHKIANNPATPERERKEAMQRYNEAFRQRELLLDEGRTLNSDFYTYRYLASQGFLPGYNFPRLPLMAYVPARRRSGGKESFLTRPRFLALSEFGPYSLIYHEGSRFKVTRAILNIGADDQVTTGAKLATTHARICPECGYGHFQEQAGADRCVACNTLLGGAPEVRELYRIENVSTRRVDRISANEEERLRQGYETQTTLQFAIKENRLQRALAVVSEAGEPLLELQYGPAATVWRMNLGWRRRKEKSIHGFLIHPVTGHWRGGVDEAGEEEDEKSGNDRTPPQRIVPYVEDRRNVLIVRPVAEFSESALTALEYALKRGIEAVFQLEESELIAEPLPRSDRRKAILLYEASEGGAGALTRLVSEPEALRAVAARALEVAHYRRKSDAEPWKPATLEQERDSSGKLVCEAGCYRCLLSYYNQPDHERIDRQDSMAVDVLCRLTRAELEIGKAAPSPGPGSVFDGVRGKWIAAVRAMGLREPDRVDHRLESVGVTADFYYDEWQAAIMIGSGDGGNGLDKRLADAGFVVARFGDDENTWKQVFAAHKELFGELKDVA
jgi:superfamily II DNA/RNA helicase